MEFKRKRSQTRSAARKRNTKIQRKKKLMSKVRKVRISKIPKKSITDLKLMAKKEENGEVDKNFKNEIKFIKSKVAKNYRLQARTILMVNSLLNEIIRNITRRAVRNSSLPIYRREPIDYYDILSATLDICGERNQWIQNIVNKAEKKSELYDDNELTDI